ncbi:NUDIX hydrolase [Microbacterium aurantiacum]|uniref:NUDIX hydrolase n=1 Tax=Microbacterium aurantiacum TaxID=162393 RepID=UPI000C7FBD8A|nr:NUDIX hydrolase [Microbacterium aurantiacum]
MTDSEDLPVAGTAVLLREGAEGLEVLLMRRPERGSFADAWVFPGGRIEDGDRIAGAREADDACRAAVRETFEEVGIVVSDLVVLSCWHPPVEAAKRIRTWFFVGADPGGEVLASAEEVIDVVWTTPADALARHAAGEWTLFPPTWVTLHAMTAVADVEAALAAAGEPRTYRTVISRTETGPVFSWDGDRLEAASLPWRYVKG